MSGISAEVAAYDYELPPHRIASRPPEQRTDSRLLVVDRSVGSFRDALFPDLLDQIRPGDTLVVNDTRVFPARLIGKKPTGARAEILLLRPWEDGRPHLCADGVTHVCEDGGVHPWRWVALVRPGSKLKPGRSVRVAPGFSVAIRESLPGGERIVELEGADETDPWALIEEHGSIPIPPYLGRGDDEQDRRRYQTVYAQARGSVAAPTAGLHFTPGLLEKIEAAGARIVCITLHVGFGTFRPVTSELIEDHSVDAEQWYVSAEAAETLNATRSGGGRIIAVGTTTCRVLETIAGPDGFRSGTGWTDLFIRPPHEFRGVDALVTNFHLPRSSLLMLVSAFAGRTRILEAYAHAIENGYRFYSYGDAMVIL